MVLHEEKNGLSKKFEDLCRDVVASVGLELYDLEYISSKSLLRLFIFDANTGTAQLEDCIKVDRALTPSIESEEWMPGDLVLEVSSPGIYRSLKTKEHFRMAKEDWVILVMNQDWRPEEITDLPKKYQKQKKFRGLLKDVTEQTIVLDVEDCQMELRFDAIKKANLDPAWP